MADLHKSLKGQNKIYHLYKWYSDKIDFWNTTVKYYLRSHVNEKLRTKLQFCLPGITDMYVYYVPVYLHVIIPSDKHSCGNKALVS